MILCRRKFSGRDTIDGSSTADRQHHGMQENVRTSTHQERDRRSSDMRGVGQGWQRLLSGTFR